MAQLTQKGEERLRLLEQAEKSGKLTSKGRDVLAGLRSIPGRSMPEQKGVVGRVWDALAVPERKAKEFLMPYAGKVPKPEPTGNLMRDVAVGTPRVLAETVSEGVPTLVSRGSILSAAAGPIVGGLAKGLRFVGPGIAKLASKTSGINPKALEAVASDVSSAFKPGIEKANKIYGGLVGGVPVGVRPGLPKVPQETLRVGANKLLETVKPAGQSRESALKARKAYLSLIKASKGAGTVANAGNKRIVDNALYLADRGQLSPRLANVARKSLDDLYGSKGVSEDFTNKARKVLSAIESKSPEIVKAKSIRAQAELAEELRNPFPITKSGGTGQFRTMATGAGLMAHPLSGIVTLPLFSPATQGAVAAIGGLGVRRLLDPLAKITLRARAAAGSALNAALSERRKKNER